MAEGRRRGGGGGPAAIWPRGEAEVAAGAEGWQRDGSGGGRCGVGVAGRQQERGRKVAAVVAERQAGGQEATAVWRRGAGAPGGRRGIGGGTAMGCRRGGGGRGGVATRWCRGGWRGAGGEAPRRRRPLRGVAWRWRHNGVAREQQRSDGGAAARWHHPGGAAARRRQAGVVAATGVAGRWP